MIQEVYDCFWFLVSSFRLQESFKVSRFNFVEGYAVLATLFQGFLFLVADKMQNSYKLKVKS